MWGLNSISAEFDDNTVKWQLVGILYSEIPKETVTLVKNVLGINGYRVYSDGYCEQ